MASIAHLRHERVMIRFGHHEMGMSKKRVTCHVEELDDEERRLCEALGQPFVDDRPRSVQRPKGKRFAEDA